MWRRVIEFALLFVVARLEPADIRRAICLLERWASRADGEGNPRHLPHKCCYGLRWAYDGLRDGQELRKETGDLFAEDGHSFFFLAGRAVNFQCFCCVERFTRYSARNTNTWAVLFGR